MSDDIDGPEWDPPELPGRDAPKIYVAGPGRFQQVVRTLSAAVGAAAIVWGVLWLGDESTRQTDLMNDQNELIRQQIVYNDCKDEAMAQIARWQAIATAAEWPPDGQTERELAAWIDHCFPVYGIFVDE